ncbi:unnamed protein product [Pseudo-nitzschia multistriata]|uniref:Uncharacterized protein n=1 Tax=Pseudo-nitzschia multistriata TaxID=183589 RepID=A0A448ZBL9_9STRA|nr:unnamed protein product [Pseudo-nitzschia multistriata]
MEDLSSGLQQCELCNYFLSLLTLLKTKNENDQVLAVQAQKDIYISFLFRLVVSKKVTFAIVVDKVVQVLAALF